jgi:hypothetical protein
MSEGAYIEQITLAHMNMNIDVSTIIMEHKQGNEQVFAIWMVQLYYSNMLEALGEDATPYNKKRALDHAKFFTLQRLPDLKSMTEASFYFLLDEANKTGWFHEDHIGYDSLDELIANIVDSESMSKGEVSNWNFIANEMIPMAKHFGVTPDKLFSASCQIKKLRGSVPVCRQIKYELEMGDKTEAQAGKEFKAVIEWLADPKVTYTQFEILAGKQDPPEAKRAVSMYEVSIPGGTTWIVIPVETETDQRIIERMLRNRMVKKPRALPWLLEKINKILPIGDMK